MLARIVEVDAERVCLDAADCPFIFEHADLHLATDLVSIEGSTSCTPRIETREPYLYNYAGIACCTL